jgi:hypothetical protein
LERDKWGLSAHKVAIKWENKEPKLTFCISWRCHGRGDIGTAVGSFPGHAPCFCFAWHGRDQASGCWNFVSSHFKSLVTVLWAINHEINMDAMIIHQCFIKNDLSSCNALANKSSKWALKVHNSTCSCIWTYKKVKHRKFSKKVLITWLTRKLYSIKLLLENMYILELPKASGPDGFPDGFYHGACSVEASLMC